MWHPEIHTYAYPNLPGAKSTLYALLLFEWFHTSGLLRALKKKKANINSLVCSSWQPPHPYQKAGCPCSALDRASNGNLDQCWHNAAFHSLCSKHQTPCHTRGEKKNHQQNTSRSFYEKSTASLWKIVTFTSLMSSQWVPFPRNPAGHGPHSHEPSAELLQSTPAKHGLDRQPSARGLDNENGYIQGKTFNFYF